MAAEFFVAVGDIESESFRRLTTVLQRLHQDPWSHLPADVRNRLGQWYRHQADESFAGFVPDTELARTEVGMAGLLVSNRRVIFHRPPRHHEMAVTDPVTVILTVHGEKNVLSLEWPGKRKPLSLTTDRAGVKALRQAFRKAGAPAQWA